MEISDVQVSIPTWNSEATLNECLSSMMKVFSEIHIYDRYSADRTLSIAERYGCIIHMHDENLGVTRTRMIQECPKPYLLMFDSDNTISSKSLREMPSAFEDLKTKDASVAAVQYLNVPLWEPLHSYCLWNFSKRKFPTKNPVRLDTACVLIDVHKAKGYTCDTPVYEDMTLGIFLYGKGFSVYVLGYPVIHLQTKKQAYEHWRFGGQYDPQSAMSVLTRIVRLCVTDNIPIQYKPIAIRQQWETLRGMLS